MDIKFEHFRKTQIFKLSDTNKNLIILQNKPIHLGKGQFGCPYCDKIMKLSGGMKRHIRVHTGEQPYSCEYCPTRFTLKSNCLTHMRNFHPQEFQN